MMKKTVKNIIISLLTLCLVVTLLPVSCFAAEGDEIRAPKKIISVVYDDSSSMASPEERWAYTNYAMQALIALLNEQDELYITYMSSPGTAVKLDTSDPEGSIKKIHDWSDCDVTPAASLVTAHNALVNISESDYSTQFWMFVMTDGGIQELYKNNWNSVQDCLDSYKSNIMSNSSPLNVVYLAIGNEAGVVMSDEKNHLYAFTSDTESKIISSIQDIANLISGRIPADKVNSVNDNTIKISSKLPLYSIAILSQNSSAIAESAKTDEENLNVLRNLSLDAGNSPYAVNPCTLYGNAAIINKKNSSGKAEVIPAGNYTIVFSDKVDVSDMTVLLEPAISLKTEITRNGVVIDDTSDLQDGDKVDIKFVPVVPGTDEVIKDSDLPKDMTAAIEYELDGSIVDSGNGTELSGVTLAKGRNVIRGTVTIPGFTPIVMEYDFDIEEVIIEYEFGIEMSQPSNLSYLRSELKDISDSNTVKFKLTNYGVPLSKDEQKQIGVSLVVDGVDFTPGKDKNFMSKLGVSQANIKLKLNDDGSYSLIPSCPPLIPSTGVKAGTYKVKVVVNTDKGISETAEFVIEANESPMALINLLVALLIILYLLYLLFVKKKFAGQTVHVETWKIQEDGGGVLQRGQSSSETLGFFSGGFLLPTRACRRKFRGLTLVAESGGTVIITGDSIAKVCVKYGTSQKKPEKYLKSIESHLIKTVKGKDQRSASDQELTQRPIYFKSSDASNSLWRIWMTDD